MRLANVSRIGMTLVLSVAPFVLGLDWAPGPMEEWRCVFNDCGIASQTCWGPQHPWGSSSCAYCTGSGSEQVCEKAHNVSCVPTEQSIACGYKMLSGTCVGEGVLGECQGGYQTGQPCKRSICTTTPIP